MTKSSLLIYVALGALGAAFVAVSILIFFAGPRRVLIRHKFALGTSIILFSGLLAGCHKSSSGGEEPMCYDGIWDGGSDSDADTDADTDTDTDISECYDTPMDDTMVITLPTNSSGQVVIDLAYEYAIPGKVESCYSFQYSYRIVQDAVTVAQEGDIQASDGQFDEVFEDFEIEVSMFLALGTYTLNLYATDMETVNSFGTLPRATYELLVINSNQS